MSKLQVLLTCEHCALFTHIPYKGQAVQDKDIKETSFEQIYYMPFMGNYRLFCAACVKKLRRIMAEFVGEVVK